MDLARSSFDHKKELRDEHNYYEMCLSNQSPAFHGCLLLDVHLAAARLSWVLRGVIHGFSEEARTHGFASPALAGFAFIEASMRHGETPSILGFT
jgi:hypothetical protein